MDKTIPPVLYRRDVTSTDLPLDDVFTTVNSSSINQTEPTNTFIEFYRDEQIGFLVVLFLFIVIGNSIVLAAIALSRERRRSRMNFFIMHLAIADLLNGPLNVLFDLITKITIYWYAGDIVCRFIQYTRAAVMYASTFMLVSLSIDRLDAVARPMNFSGSWLRAKILIGSAWLISLLFAAPQLFLFQEKHHYGGPQCYIDLTEAWQWQLYLSMIALVIFVIPAIIICICYVVIVAIIWRSSRLLKPSDSQKSLKSYKSKDEECLNGHSRSNSSKESCSSSRGVIPQAKIRTIKMTFLIVLVFIVCWSPYFIFNLCDVYGYVDWKNPSTRKISTFIQSLAPLNSAANPVIYGIFSTRICRRLYLFRKVQDHVCKCCKKEPIPRQMSGNEYTSMSETEDIRLTSDIGGNRSAAATVPRIPYVRQPMSEADRELLSIHVKSQNV
ncbi:hypothetical protein SNE40_023240 [Patella caerulea]|uniref:G-protein coupled receptors family 1 profile domain-containing protein n=2 Tax=Patella caerulea TaxID=87958 RepID=A0AAN8GG92_PATCE